MMFFGIIDMMLYFKNRSIVSIPQRRFVVFNG
jgi:hypothetical protein